MQQDIKLKVPKKKAYWNTLPWSETEYVLTSFQNCVFKAAQRKDTFSRKKLNFFISTDARWNLLALRRNSERKRPWLVFKKFLFKENCHLNIFFIEFLKFKTFQSSQRFKLAKILTNNPLFSKDIVEAELICYFLNSILLGKNLLVFQAFYNALNQSYSKKRYGQDFPGKEKIFSFFLKRLFKAFPNQKTFQAFQFYWILLLAKEEKVRFIIEPESQVLIEPNLLALRFFSCLNKSNEENLLKHESLLCFQNFLNTNFSKVIKDWNQHPFLCGTFKSFSLKTFLRKWEWFRIFLFLRKNIVWNLLNNLSFRGFMRVRGSFISLLGKKQGFHYLKILCLQPFLLLGLDLDIKKWQQSKSSVSQEIRFLPKSFPSPCFFLATSEEGFLFFHCNGKSFSHVLKFVRDWFFFSFSHISFQYLFLENLIKGLEIQNHFINFKPVNPLKRASPSILEPSSSPFLPLPSKGKNGDAIEWDVKCNERVPFGKTKAEIELLKISRNKKIIVDILPSKAYQKRFFESIKKICIQCRGKSSKFLIASLISIFSSWQDGIFSNGRIISVKKIFRKIDSFLHFKLFRWARRNHPTWSRQKIVERYFPKGKIWSYAMKKKVDNWVFCDNSSLITPLFLRKLSWFDGKNFQKIILLEFVFSGFF